MAKHRKTRQEKRIADHRHVSYHLDTLPAEDHSPIASKSEYSLPNQPIHVKTKSVDYSFVAHDLKKTTIITATIILAQIFLFIILNRV